MTSIIYFIFFFVIVALLLFGAFEMIPKINRLKHSINQEIQSNLENNPEQLKQHQMQQKQNSVAVLQSNIITILVTIFVLEIIYPEIATNYLLIAMFLIEAYFVYLGFKLPNLVKKNGKNDTVVPTDKQATVARLKFFSFIVVMIGIDVLSLLIQLLLKENIKFF
jgi:Ca2+/Na+ antiporter